MNERGFSALVPLSQSGAAAAHNARKQYRCSERPGRDVPNSCGLGISPTIIFLDDMGLHWRCWELAHFVIFIKRKDAGYPERKNDLKPGKMLDLNAYVF